jgi:DNA-nicking Smr family endonuclease
MKRKLGRGRMEIDARLDLHGKTKAAAHGILKSFLINAQSRGHRTVLVITGKGGQGIARHTLHSFDVIHNQERTGVLMRSVPQWLTEPDFRNLVIGFQPAHPKHGGGGALYVRVRRIKGMT